MHMNLSIDACSCWFLLSLLCAAARVAAVKCDYGILKVLQLTTSRSASCMQVLNFVLRFMTRVRQEGRSWNWFCDFIFASSYHLVNPKVSPRPPDGS